MKQEAVSFQTPILFIVFNRLETTREVLSRIKELKPAYLYVASDGPRDENKADKEKCEAIRQMILQEVDWDCKLQTLFRDNNLGCGNGPAEAITWFFEHVEQGIILEDDCLPANSFFSYCEKLLEQYKNDERVMHIAGSNFLKNKGTSYSYFVTKTPIVWGWATWRRAWQKYDFYIKDYPFVIDYLGVDSFWREKFEEVYKRKITSCWDYQWTYCIIKNKGLCINPVKNLILNIGFSNESTHMHSKPWWYENVKLEELEITKYRTKLEPDVKKESLLFKWIHYGEISIVDRVRRKLRHFYK